MKVSCKRTIRHVIIAHARWQFTIEGDRPPPKKIVCIIRNPTVVTNTSAIIPNANVNVVIPNMNILGGDEVKAGLLLTATYCERA